jgi:hypothetical protein
MNPTSEPTEEEEGRRMPPPVKLYETHFGDRETGLRVHVREEDGEKVTTLDYRPNARGSFNVEWYRDRLVAMYEFAPGHGSAATRALHSAIDREYLATLRAQDSDDASSDGTRSYVSGSDDVEDDAAEPPTEPASEKQRVSKS